MGYLLGRLASDKVAGEHTNNAAAGAQDVLVVDGRVYVACGGEGIAVYPLGAVEPRTVVDSEHLGQLLHEAGLSYHLLNAKQDAAELDSNSDSVLSKAERDAAHSLDGLGGRMVKAAVDKAGKIESIYSSC